MKWRLPRLGLPLLAKELVEIANRRSTYVLRVLYALTLFGFVLYFYWQHTYGQSGLPYEILGTGGHLFERIVEIQMWGIYILTPLLTASSIAGEKERDTLQLLFLTRLGPWTILFEKLLGRLVPMAAYLLLTMPVFAVAYSLGGVETSQIVLAAVAMGMAMLHAGVVSLFCSTWCRTTANAFLMTFAVLGISYLLPVAALRLMVGGEQLQQIAHDVARRFGGGMTMPNGDVVLPLNGEQLPMLHIPPTLLASSDVSMFIGLGGKAPDPTWRIWLQLGPMLLYAAVFLVLARRCLVRRAHLAPRNLLLKMFRRADDLLQYWNKRLTRGIVLVDDQGVLPENAPIHWRETRKRALGTFRYLVRVLVFLEFPALLFGLIAATAGVRTMRSPAMSALIGLFWVIAVLGTAVRSATLFAAERSQSTLDVLLTTPMRASDMLREKVRALHRFMLVLATPLLTSYVLHTATTAAVTSVWDWLSYLVGAVATVAIYLPLVCWTGVLCGLRSSTQTRALFTTLAVLVLVGYVAPSALLMLADTSLWLVSPAQVQPVALVTRLIVPTSYPLLLETEPQRYSVASGPALGNVAPTTNPGVLIVLGLLNSALFGLLLYAVRKRCLSQCSRMLGRPESPRPFVPALGRPVRAELYDLAATGTESPL